MRYIKDKEIFEKIILQTTGKKVDIVWCGTPTGWIMETKKDTIIMGGNSLEAHLYLHKIDKKELRKLIK